MPYGIVLGAPCSGKTTVARALARGLGMQLVEWEPALAQIKEELSTPENPVEELPPARVVEYYSKRIQKGSRLFDGFAFDSSVLAEFIKKVGPPEFFLQLQVGQADLTKRFKLKSEMEAAAELSEEDQAKLAGFISKGNELTTLTAQLASQDQRSRRLELDGSGSIEVMTARALQLFKKKIICVNLNGDYGNEASTFFKKVALMNKCMFVNVGKVIERQMKANPQVQEQLAMRGTQTDRSYPSNYSPELVTTLIKQHLEKAVNFSSEVVLFGYPSANVQLKNKSE